MDQVRIEGLDVAKVLYDFIEREALAGTAVTAQAFWAGLAALIREFAPRNRELLGVRDALQKHIDDYHRRSVGHPFDEPDYESFLREIGYLLPEGADFNIDTENVDDEIARVAGPQLVVPVSNARYALNAANARWGSLYDALYGTDAIAEDGGAARGPTYNKVRGERVVARARALLDEAAPLAQGRHRDAAGYAVENGELIVGLRGGARSGLARPPQFVGYRGDAAEPEAVLLRSHGLHIEIKIDRNTMIGRDDPAGIADLNLESAVTTIIDLEDSVAAVDAEDKVAVYRNWLGLMKGTLAASFEKNGRLLDRRLNPDRLYRKPDGGEFRAPGRSLMLVRNVGLHMYTDAVLDHAGDAVPEGLLDAAVTALITPAFSTAPATRSTPRWKPAR